MCLARRGHLLSNPGWCVPGGTSWNASGISVGNCGEERKWGGVRLVRPGVGHTGAWECEPAAQGDQPTAEGRDRSPGAAQCTAQQSFRLQPRRSGMSPESEGSSEKGGRIITSKSSEITKNDTVLSAEARRCLILPVVVGCRPCSSRFTGKDAGCRQVEELGQGRPAQRRLGDRSHLALSLPQTLPTDLGSAAPQTLKPQGPSGGEGQL